MYDVMLAGISTAQINDIRLCAEEGLGRLCRRGGTSPILEQRSWPLCFVSLCEVDPLTLPGRIRFAMKCS